jgi:hypothetical protein
VLRFDDGVSEEFTEIDFSDGSAWSFNLTDVPGNDFIKTITVHYTLNSQTLGFSFNVFIYVPETVVLISAPQTTVYFVENTLEFDINFTGMIIAVNYNNGMTAQVSSFNFAGTWSFEVEAVQGEQFLKKVTVTLQSLAGTLSVSFEIFVAENTVQNEVVAIEICDISLNNSVWWNVAEERFEVLRGRDIDLQGIELIITLQNPVTHTIITQNIPLLRAYTNYNFNLDLASRVVTISYGGLTTTLATARVDYTIDSVTINQASLLPLLNGGRLHVAKGNMFNTLGIMLEVNYVFPAPYSAYNFTVLVPLLQNNLLFDGALLNLNQSLLDNDGNEIFARDNVTVIYGGIVSGNEILDGIEVDGKLQLTIIENKITSVEVCKASLAPLLYQGFLRVLRGSELNLQGVNLIITFDYAPQQIIPLLRGYTNFDSNQRIYQTIGGHTVEIFERNVIITYNGIEAKEPLKVLIVEDVIISIEVCQDSLTDHVDVGGYLVVARGSDINTQGVMLIITYEHSLTQKVPLLRGYTNFNPDARIFERIIVPDGNGGQMYGRGPEILTRDVLITYNGLTTTLRARIEDNRTISSISIFRMPDVVHLPEGMVPDFTGGLIERVFNDGTRDLLPMTDPTVTILGYNPNILNRLTGERAGQALTARIGSNEAIFNLTTHRKLDAARVIGYLYLEYIYGDYNLIEPFFNLDMGGGMLLTNFVIPGFVVQWFSPSLNRWVDINSHLDMPVLPLPNQQTYLTRTLIDGNEYFVESYVEIQIIIRPRPITITANDLGKIYGLGDPTLTVTVQSFTFGHGGLVAGDTLAINVSRETGNNVGTYVITPQVLIASATNNNDRYEFTVVEGTFAITPRELSLSNDITFTIPSPTFTNTPKVVTVTYWMGGTTNPITQANIQYYRVTGIGGSSVQIDGSLWGELLPSAPTSPGEYVAVISNNFTVPDGFRYRRFDIFAPQ